ncbi:MAG TPA: Ni/Fe hydrogenase subunit alpha [Thermomicrobiaceae bacterium]|nr:Ni/Fe hydrogenase subunit alpha [Thermomicrobiaceae bacterium]
MSTRTRTIKVERLTRVEGEGALTLRLRNGTVAGVECRIYEPPRFFEALLRGRHFTEAPDITARVCGICPVAYQMSAVQAMEAACGVVVPQPLRDLRRLLYYGEWIESHALHIYLLHAPDFLGFESGIALARDHPDVVARGLELKKTGNAVMATVGGREIHPVNVRVGGFYSLPARAELARLAERLRWAREAALETVRWAAGFAFPDVERDYELVALRPESGYPIDGGRLVSSSGLDLAPEEYEAHFVEEQAPYSHALQSHRRDGGSYLVGPLARYGLNAARLAPLARQAAEEAGLGPLCANPYRSILVRAVEVVHACDEAVRLCEEYREPEAPSVPVNPRAGVGHGWTEAPRGLLYHRYEIDDAGTILAADIVPPTAQNQRVIEEDLRVVADQHLALPEPELALRCEAAIRNHDPCISCATHFLRLEVDRGAAGSGASGG